MRSVRRSLFSLLSRRLVLSSVAVSLVFLLALVGLYHARMQEQRADAARGLNLLLQVSLENAMLKRDIPGLQEIINRFSQQEGISTVAILNPEGEVRFASRPELVGRRLDLDGGALCPGCRWDGRSGLERSELIERGLADAAPVLRALRAVPNRSECHQCHPANADKPVNGLLLVDHAAQDLRANALAGALALAGSGLSVVLALIGGIYATLRRHVIQPIEALDSASAAIAQGDYAARVPAEGDTELAALGQSFNAMAEQLEGSMAALQTRERFVKGLVEALPDGVRIIGPDFSVLLANAAYHRIHGAAPGTAIGQKCHFSSMQRTEPCVPTLATCPLVALHPDDAPIRFFASHHRPDGREVSVEVHAARLAASPGARGGAKDGAKDGDCVIEVIRDLDAAVQISHEQRLSELGQLATGIAHEIRNPLSSVALLLHDAEAHDSAVPPATMVRLIRQEVERCLGITESLLKLGAPPAQEPQLVDMSELVPDMLSLLRFEAEQCGVSVTTDLASHLRVLAADNDMRIVLINLIQNAFHAMPRGGTLLIAGTRAPGGRIALTLSDTGIGIPAEHLRSIFLPFWSRRADGVAGTGLGLSICRSIIRAAKGDILVSSVEGQGTTFTVDLPDADALPDADNAD